MRLVGGQGEHDEIGIQPMQCMTGVRVVAGLWAKRGVRNKGAKERQEKLEGAEMRVGWGRTCANRLALADGAPQRCRHLLALLSDELHYFVLALTRHRAIR